MKIRNTTACIETLEPRALMASSPLNLSFGGGTGEVHIPLGIDVAINGSATQPDGKIVVCGYTFGDNPGAGRDIFVARLEATGAALDPTFGSNGITITDLGKGDDEGAAVAIMPNGNIAVAGSSTHTGQAFAVVVAYKPDGVVDTTFGNRPFNFTGSRLTDGVCYIDIGPVGSITYGAATAIFVQPYDSSTCKLLVSGFASQTSPANDHQEHRDIFLARLWGSDGTVDATFAGALTVVNPTRVPTLDIGGDADETQAAVVQPDGKILIAATSTVGHLPGYGLARFEADGRHDFTIGAFGRRTTASRRLGVFSYDVATQPDGKIVVAGNEFSGHSRSTLRIRPSVTRFLADGQLDKTFGNGGVSSQKVGGFAASLSIAVAPDGRIWTAGQSFASIKEADGTHFATIVTRCNADGSPDTTLGKRGVAVLDVVRRNAAPDDPSDPTIERPILRMLDDGGAMVLVASDAMLHVVHLLPPPPAGVEFVAGALAGRMPRGASAAGAKAKKFKVIVSNAGSRDADGTVVVRMFASSDAVFDDSDTPFADVRVRVKIKSLERGRLKLKFRFPSAQAPGAYYLFAQVDGTGLFAEHDETNNVSLAWGPFIV